MSDKKLIDYRYKHKMDSRVRDYPLPATPENLRCHVPMTAREIARDTDRAQQLINAKELEIQRMRRKLETTINQSAQLQRFTEHQMLIDKIRRETTIEIVDGPTADSVTIRGECIIEEKISVFGLHVRMDDGPVESAKRVALTFDQVREGILQDQLSIQDFNTGATR